MYQLPFLLPPETCLLGNITMIIFQNFSNIHKHLLFILFKKKKTFQVFTFGLLVNTSRPKSPIFFVFLQLVYFSCKINNFFLTFSWC